MIAAETDNHYALVFAKDGLVDVPAGLEMGKNDGAHGDCGFNWIIRWFRRWLLFENETWRWLQTQTIVDGGRWRWDMEIRMSTIDDVDGSATAVEARRNSPLPQPLRLAYVTVPYR